MTHGRGYTVDCYQYQIKYYLSVEVSTKQTSLVPGQQQLNQRYFKYRKKIDSKTVMKFNPLLKQN